jgi:hypothetical protein
MSDNLSTDGCHGRQPSQQNLGDDGGRSMSVPDGRMRDIYGQSVNMVFYLGESGAGPIQPLRPAIGAPPVILQSTHEAALDVVDFADLKHRALELS